MLKMLAVSIFSFSHIIFSIVLLAEISLCFCFAFPQLVSQANWHILIFSLPHRAGFIIFLSSVMADPSFTHLFFFSFFPASRISHLGCQYCPSPFRGLSSWKWHCLKLTPQRGWPVHHFGEDSQVDSLSPHCSQDFWLFGSYFYLFTFLSLCFLSTARLQRWQCKKMFIVWFLGLLNFMTIYANCI